MTRASSPSRTDDSALSQSAYHRQRTHLMLHSHSVTAPIGLDPPDFVNVMEQVERQGWGLGYLSSARALLKVAGIPNGRVPPPTLATMSGSSGTGLLSAELLFKDNDLYFAESAVETDSATAALYGGFYEVEFLHRRSTPLLDVGIVSASNADLTSKVDVLVGDLTRSINQQVDGRKTRHMSFEWTSRNPVSDPTRAPPSGPRVGPRRRSWERTRSEGSTQTPDVTYVDANYSEEEKVGSEALCDEFTRTLLREVCQARASPIQALNASRPKAEAQTTATVGRLLELGLLGKEVLVSCKKTSMPIFRVPDVTLLTSGEASRAHCHYCHSALTEERMSEVICPTTLGEKLNQRSHWLTVWTTAVLAEVGVPNSATRWSMSESGQEVDLVASVLDEAWIFELKDREFGGGDAHPFSYRCARYSPDRALVVTPTRVSEEAKRIFGEIAADRGERNWLEGGGRSQVPIYIEGLSSLQPTLARQVRSCAARYALDQLEGVRLATHLAVDQILETKFGERREEN